MIILFPRRKGIKIATTIIFEAIERKEDFKIILGMIYFASAFGAITPKEQQAIIQHLKEHMSLGEL